MRRIAAVGDYAFYDCSAPTKLELPATLKTLGADAFDRCSALTKVRLPDAIRKIGENAFWTREIYDENGWETADVAELTLVARPGTFGWEYAKTNGFQREEPDD